MGALVVEQSKIESEFPPSVRHSPATFPQGGRLISGSCFAVAGVVGMFCLFLFPYISGRTKKSHLFRGGIRLSKKVAERRPFSYIIDMGDALC